MRLRWVALALALGITAVACEDGEDDSPGSAVGTQADSASPTFAPGARDSMTVITHTPTPASTPTDGGTPATPTVASPTSSPSGGATVTQTAAGNHLVEAAIDDLAARLGVGRGTISVVSFDEVEWNDGSLGCPQPGMSYTQALVNGYRIVLRYAGTEYAYHGRAGSAPFYCANPA